jgi:hypothetical protein
VNRANKYIEREEYLVKTRSSTVASSKTKTKTKVNRQGEEEEEEVSVLMRAPDWLSTNPTEWRFYGTGEYVRAKAPNSEKLGSIRKSTKSTGSSVSSIKTGATSTSTSSSGTTSSSFFKDLLNK